jgi:hypothetical protein
MEDKSRGAPAPPPDQQGPPTGPPLSGPQREPDAQDLPSERQQERLREQQKQNTVERERRLGDRAIPPGSGNNPYPRPW